MTTIQACSDCRRTQSPARRVCAACGSARLFDTDLRLRGSVDAVTTVHKAAGDAFEALVPYVLVLVRLDGGGRRLGHGISDLSIGDRVAALPPQPDGILRFGPERG